MGTRARFHLMVVVAGLGFGLTAPLTALFASDLGASDLVAGIAVSSIAISLLLVDFFGTRFVPRIDARAAMAVSLAVFGAGSVMSAFVPNVELMILARVAQGFGAALFMGGALQLAVRIAPGGAAGAIGAFNGAWFAGIALGPPPQDTWTRSSANVAVYPASAAVRRGRFGSLPAAAGTGSPAERRCGEASCARAPVRRQSRR
jgi:MFS family permease